MSPRPEGVFRDRAIPPKPPARVSVDRLVCPLCGLLYDRTPIRVPDGACRWCATPQSDAASDLPAPGSPTPPPIPGVGAPDSPTRSPQTPLVARGDAPDNQGPNHNNRRERP